MDELFSVRVLTVSINNIKTPSLKVYKRIFKGKDNMAGSSMLQFDVLSGSSGILKNISIYAPAEFTDRTGRKTVTMQAPRLAQKRFIPTADMDSLRQHGTRLQTALMQRRIATEQKDMKGIMDRTIEFWCVNALKGKIYDADLTTVLVDYNLDAAHSPVLTGTELWTDPASDPVNKIREFTRITQDDSMAAIEEWVAFVGFQVMDALLDNANVRDLLRTDKGSQMASTGRIELLSGVELIEYNETFEDSTGSRQRFVAPNEFLLVGLCDDLVDMPYAPVLDDDAPGGVGNIDTNGKGQLYFSKSWKEKDPSGRWVKSETRPLPVLKRPGAVIHAVVV